MTRRKFFGLPTMSAVTVGAVSAAPVEPLKVPNGQCPVCGTQAPGYLSGTCTVEDPGPVGRTVLKHVPCEPSMLTRCRVCNAAFYQDASKIP